MVKSVPNGTYRVAAGIALAAAVFLVWVSLGVGIIGADGDPANAMYLGVLGIGIVGAAIARFRARGMAYALVTMAVAQAVVTVVALALRLGLPWSGPLELIMLNGVFIALFAASAWLFLRASHVRAGAS